MDKNVSPSAPQSPTASSSQYQSIDEGHETDHLEKKGVENVLLERHRYLEALLTAVPDAIVTLDKKHRIVEWNPGAEHLFGYTKQEAIGNQIDALITDNYVSDEATQFTEKTLQGQVLSPVETKRLKKDGTPVDVIISASPILIDGVYIGAVAIYTGITALKQAENALRESEQRYALAAKGANDGLWDWDLRTNIVFYSSRWKAMHGYEDHEVANVLEEWMNRVHPDDLEHLKVEISAHLEGITPYFESEHRTQHKDGSYRWMLSRGLAIRDEQGICYRMAGSQTDITDRKHVEEQLLHDAFHDVLTGLPNRALFIDRLGRAIARSLRNPDNKFSVLFIDLDRFKLVNDSFGHTIGDKLLITIARRLTRCLRAIDTVARLGGDEFAILLEDIQSIDDPINVAERIQTELQNPIPLGGHEVFTSGSIGIVMSDEDYYRPEETLMDADIAMYHAKSLGKARYVIFEKSMRIQAVARMELETDLRRAIGNQEFRVYYQPILSMDTNQIIGFEALVRWQHPQRGLLHPIDFITVAEETGIIIPIDWWVLRKACQQLSEWQKSYPSDPPLSINVNLSSKHFNQKDLVRQIENILQVTGINPECLNLEITETVFLENTDTSIMLLYELRKLGVQLQIDDFGTGYSSLGYLQDFPIDAIKIDRSFISKIGEDGNNAELVNTILSLAQDLGMQAIAEGVENRLQKKQLKSLNCELVQGYLFCEPINVEQVRKLLEGTGLKTELDE